MPLSLCGIGLSVGIKKENEMNNKGSDFVVGILMGAFIVAVLFMTISTYNGALLERGLAEYNSTTGDLQLKECKK